jgi:hypothetical protein
MSDPLSGSERIRRYRERTASRHDVTSAAPPMSGAERIRRYRQRRHHSQVDATVPCDDACVSPIPSTSIRPDSPPLVSRNAACGGRGVCVRARILIMRTVCIVLMCSDDR